MPIIWTLAVDLGLFCVSVLSGMLGIGVAFAAIPILAIGGGDLVHELQPVALFLNGVTALFSAVAFARAGYVDWPRALWISAVATLLSPCGAYIAHFLEARLLWACYLAALVAVLFLLGIEGNSRTARDWFVHALVACVPISLFSGMLGVGPGFLLVPTLIFLGVKPRAAAAINSVAVVPSSFASLIPHIGTATVSVATYAPIVAIAAGGALLGGYLSSYKASDRTLRYLFVVVLLCLASYRAVALYWPQDQAIPAGSGPCEWPVPLPTIPSGGACR